MSFGVGPALTLAMRPQTAVMGAHSKALFPMSRTLKSRPQTARAPATATGSSVPGPWKKHDGYDYNTLVRASYPVSSFTPPGTHTERAAAKGARQYASRRAAGKLRRQLRPLAAPVGKEPETPARFFLFRDSSSSRLVFTDSEQSGLIMSGGGTTLSVWRCWDAGQVRSASEPPTVGASAKSPTSRRYNAGGVKMVGHVGGEVLGVSATSKGMQAVVRRSNLAVQLVDTDGMCACVHARCLLAH